MNTTLNIYTIPIQGMTCAACVLHVTNALNLNKNTNVLSVNLATETAVINSESLNIESINKLLKDAGYSIKFQKINFEYSGAKNENDNIINQFLSVQGVIRARYDNNFEFSIIEEIIDQKSFETLVNKYNLESSVPNKNLYEKIITKLSSIYFLSFITFTLSFLSMLPMISGIKFSSNEQLAVLFTLIFVTPVFLIGFIKFLIPALKAAKQATSNMNTLISLGATVTYIYSLFIFIYFIIGKENFTYPTYFETSSMIISLVLIGKSLENIAKNKTFIKVEKLLGDLPETVIRIYKDQEKLVKVYEINIDDIIRITPGNIAPLDGIIINGSSDIDQKIITGESFPIYKTQNDSVYAGTINLSAPIDIKVTKTLGNNLLDDVKSLVSQAQSSNIPIQTLVDKISSIFVPSIIFIAISSFLFWFLTGSNNLGYALIPAISVLVIACPCALGLATPAAIIVAIGNAASKGLFFKNAESIEKFEKFDSVIIDKTGTLTEGHPTVKKIESYGIEVKELIKLAGSAVKGSTHPYSEALIKHANQEKIQISYNTKFEQIPGKGIISFVNNEQILIGNKTLMNQFNISINDNTIKKSSQLFVVKNKKHIGSFYLEDKIREDASELINYFRRHNKTIILASGDNFESTKYVSEKLAINEFYSEKLPGEKLEILNKLLENNKKPMVIGDGINDAPMLANSYIGIAMGGGADIAKDTGDIIIKNNSLKSLIDAHKISIKSMSCIRQNLFWAFLYNLILIPIAAGILYPFINNIQFNFFIDFLFTDKLFLNPMVAAGAMAISSLSVILNSLRLNFNIKNSILR